MTPQSVGLVRAERRLVEEFYNCPLHVNAGLILAPFLSGDLKFGSDFAIAQSGDVEQPGQIDEAGGARNVTTSANATAEALLFEVAVTANSSGQVTFTAGPADDPAHELTVFGRDALIPSSQIHYGDVIIDVRGLDDAPISAPDTYSTRVDRSLQVSASEGLLSNDREVDGQTMTAEVVELPQHGILDLSATGAFVYTPDVGFEGTDTYSYHASDGLLTSVEEVVTIRVREIDENAIVLIDLHAVDETGETINEVAVGESFTLQAVVEDLRPNPEGVFAAYADIEWV
jgi:hypothetical protein